MRAQSRRPHPFLPGAAVRVVRDGARPSTERSSLRGLLAGRARDYSAVVRAVRRRGALFRSRVDVRAVPEDASGVFSRAKCRTLRGSAPRHRPCVQVRRVPVSRSATWRIDADGWQRRAEGRRRGRARSAASLAAPVSRIQPGGRSRPWPGAPCLAPALASSAPPASGRPSRRPSPRQRPGGVSGASMVACGRAHLPRGRPLRHHARPHRRRHDDWSDDGGVCGEVEEGGGQRGACADGGASRNRTASTTRAATSSFDASASMTIHAPAAA